MTRDLAPAWGVEPAPVVFYAEAPADPVGVFPVTIVDTLNDPGVLGWHTDELGVEYAKTLDAGGADATTPSHEICESLIDPTCDDWIEGYAKEIADPVEGDRYPIRVTLFGETRDVWVSNFVLPAFFSRTASGPWDLMGKLSAPFTMTPGGYMVILHRDGTTSQIYARTDSRRLARHAHRMADPTSRVHRRLMYQPPRPTITLADVAEDPRR
jgi:hypothetical protein